MTENISCPVCGYAGENIREYRATEKIYSCSKCGKQLLKAPFLLAAYETRSGVILNV